MLASLMHHRRIVSVFADRPWICRPSGGRGSRMPGCCLPWMRSGLGQGRKEPYRPALGEKLGSSCIVHSGGHLGLPLPESNQY